MSHRWNQGRQLPHSATSHRRRCAPHVTTHQQPVTVCWLQKCRCGRAFSWLLPLLAALTLQPLELVAEPVLELVQVLVRALALVQALT